jgi:hypothetical protein
MNWDVFCKEKIGMSRPTADRIIRNLAEFGPKYFELSAVLQIPPEQYRQIASAVTNGGLVCEGETIEISADNAPRLASAVETLREAATAPESGRASAEVDVVTALRRARKAFNQSLDAYFCALQVAKLDGERTCIREEMDAKRALLEIAVKTGNLPGHGAV